MAQDLNGKVVIVTGAAGGQGAADAKLLVERGAKVVLTDFNSELGEKTAAELGEGAIFMKHDVSSEEDWARVIEETLTAFGQINALVNNAGILKMEPLEASSAETIEKLLAVNVRSVYLGMMAVIPELKEAGGGSIVNISSLAGMNGQANAVAYSGSKWAVRGMTKSAALELGQYGIRVNSVHPGTIATPMTSAMLGSRGDAPFPIAAMNRVGTPEDIAPAVAFLVSDESTYISGAELVIDGASAVGQSAQFTAMMSQG
ncbi:glucose 1-dehydrogenase [Glutamicibacter arilaitensis]|uniref:glucose 1-dehydrogenase n=1 Tax=Glutamicibacter arilaitensis TaxID=256701 RepID=UPI003A94A33F